MKEHLQPQCLKFIDKLCIKHNISTLSITVVCNTIKGSKPTFEYSGAMLIFYSSDMIWYGIRMLWYAISMLCYEISKIDMIWYAIVWYGMVCYALL